MYKIVFYCRDALASSLTLQCTALVWCVVDQLRRKNVTGNSTNIKPAQFGAQLLAMGRGSLCTKLSTKHTLRHKTGGQFVSTCGGFLASFPGLPTTQFSITCNIQNRGGRPGSLYHVNDVSVYLGRQRWGGIPHHKITFCVHLLCFEPGAVHFSLHECSKLQSLFEPETTSKIRLQVHSFDGGPLIHLGTVLSLIIRTSDR